MSTADLTAEDHGSINSTMEALIDAMGRHGVPTELVAKCAPEFRDRVVSLASLVRDRALGIKLPPGT
jgi:hypothetical protein